MQQLVIKNGKILATHTSEQDLRDKYPGCEIIMWDGPLELDEIGTRLHDPRTKEEKRNNYTDKRRMAYPEIGEQLDMIYWDGINETENWLRGIDHIKRKYPKPKVKDVQEKYNSATDCGIKPLLDLPRM